MNRIINLFLSFLFIALMACGSSGSGTTSSETTRSGGRVKVAEDLSTYRPKYPVADEGAVAARVEPTNHVNDRVAVLMDTVASVNRNIKYAQGYRILAYNGSERQTVMNLRKTIVNRLPYDADYLTYQQPNFRLKVGDFFSRIEAQQALNKISDLVPNAQIVQEQINVPKK